MHVIIGSTEMAHVDPELSEPNEDYSTISNADLQNGNTNQEYDNINFEGADNNEADS